MRDRKPSVIVLSVLVILTGCRGLSSTPLATTAPPPATQPPSPEPPTPTGPEPMLPIQGASRVVAVQDAYAYITIGTQLAALQVSDPTEPVLIGLSSTLQNVEDLIVAGDYAYAAAGEDDLRILDVSDPTAVAEIGSYATPAPVWSIVLASSYAYIAAGDGLHILDVSNPATPASVGFLATPDATLDVAVDGGIAYVTERHSVENESQTERGGLRVIDVSSPEAPRQLGFYSMDPRQEPSYVPSWDRVPGAQDVVVSGNLAYVTYATGGDGGLRIVDVSNPAEPVEVGDYRGYIAYVSDVLVVQDAPQVYAYLATGVNQGALVVDVTNPAQPSAISPIEGGGAATAFALVGTTLVAANEFGGLRTIDISNPAQPVGIGAYDTAEPDAATPFDLNAQLDADAVLVFRTTDNTLLLTDPSLTMIGSSPLPGGETQIWLASGFATYLTPDPGGGQGLHMLAADGSSSFAPAPTSPGELVDGRLAPDGAKIAWLFDLTEVRPSMADGCDPSAGCVGLVYELVLTNSAGEQAEMVWRHVVESLVGAEKLYLGSWREDSEALFTCLDSGSPGPFYPPECENVLEILLGETVTTLERSAGYSAEEMAVSPDGRWLAVAGGSNSVTVDSVDGQTFEVPYAEYPNPYAAQLAFSPSSAGLAWVELTTPPREMNIESLVIKYLAFETGIVQSLLTLDLASGPLPSTGPWLSNDLLIVEYANQSWIIDVASEQAVTWPPQFAETTLAATVGVIRRGR